MPTIVCYCWRGDTSCSASLACVVGGRMLRGGKQQNDLGVCGHRYLKVSSKAIKVFKKEWGSFLQPLIYYLSNTYCHDKIKHGCLASQVATWYVTLALDPPVNSALGHDVLRGRMHFTSGSSPIALCWTGFCVFCFYFIILLHFSFLSWIMSIYTTHYLQRHLITVKVLQVLDTSTPWYQRPPALSGGRDGDIRHHLLRPKRGMTSNKPWTPNVLPCCPLTVSLAAISGITERKIGS